MKKLKIGDRVQDDGFLGEGEVVEIVMEYYNNKAHTGYMVKFDKTPDVRYNMAQNPCFMLKGSIQKIR